MAIVVPIVSEWNPKGLEKSMADFQKAEGGWAKAGVAVKKAAIPAAIALGALTAAAYDFTKAAVEDEKSAATMAASLAKTTGATKAQIAATEDWISVQGKQLGIADDDLRPALAKLATATGDVAKAQELAALSMDISAATGKDLASTSSAMAKAAAGNASALKKMIPGLDEAVLKSGDLAAIQAEVASKVGGAADVAANTAAGKMQRFTLAMDEAKESIGYALLPALTALLGPLQGLGEWAQNNTPLLLAVGIAIGTIAASILLVNAAMAVWNTIQTVLAAKTGIVTAAQWLWNAALTANPIGIVIVAIAAFIAAIVLLWNKCEWFRNGVLAVWAAIQAGIEAVVNWFRDTAWPILKTVFDWIASAVELYLIPWKLAFEAIQVVVGFLADAFVVAFDTIKDAVSSAWRFIQPIIDKISAGINAIKSGMDFVGNIGGAIGGALGRSAPSVQMSRAGGSPVTVNVTAGIGDPVAIARQIENVLTARNIRLGGAY
jgi:phage-related protein